MDKEIREVEKVINTFIAFSIGLAISAIIVGYLVAFCGDKVPYVVDTSSFYASTLILCTFIFTLVLRTLFNRNIPR